MFLCVVSRPLSAELFVTCAADGSASARESSISVASRITTSFFESIEITVVLARYLRIASPVWRNMRSLHLFSRDLANFPRERENEGRHSWLALLKRDRAAMLLCNPLRERQP